MVEQITHYGTRYSIHIEDGRVSIYRDGVWSGDGRWDGCRITDCSAQLGDDADETETVYAALEGALEWRLSGKGDA